MNPAPYAVCAATARGRFHPEPEAPTRSPWQRDRDRIIHSSAFRKLQYKTQVFVNHEGDFYRTRLTHSIEVAQIARSVARALGLDEDLTEALALAHDVGHPPFGHAGEEALNLAMKPFGGFDHNAQSLRVVTLLESRYAGWDGLNLTWETLEGLAKHNGPLRSPPPYIAEYNDRHKLDLSTHASAEAQVAAMSDDVAYHSHDLDDGLRARLFGPDEIAHLPIVGEALSAARRSSLDVPPPRLRHETIRRVIDAMVSDLLAETGRRLGKLDGRETDAIRRARQKGMRVYGEPLIQHLLLDESEYQNKDWDYAARRVMSPPFRNKQHQDSLWAGLSAGSLQVVATDHCAFTTEQKRAGIGNFAKIPNGTGGLEDRMPLLWTYGVSTGRLTKEEFVAVTSTNIAKILNLYPKKGAIREGSDADIVVWDPKRKKTITAKTQQSAIDYNVFEGFEVTGLPRFTLTRGEVAVTESKVDVHQGHGEFVAREAKNPVNRALSTWKEITAPRKVERAGIPMSGV